MAAAEPPPGVSGGNRDLYDIIITSLPVLM